MLRCGLAGALAEFSQVTVGAVSATVRVAGVLTAGMLSPAPDRSLIGRRGQASVWQWHRIRVVAAVTTALLDQLTDARRRGEPFERAWPLARDRALTTVAGKDREEWEGVLASTLPSWRASFERWPAPARERALLVLAEAPIADSLARIAA